MEGKTKNSTMTIKIGGWASIVGAILFTGVFTFLAIKFNYPDVLDGPAKQVLPNPIAMGSTGRFV